METASAAFLSALEQGDLDAIMDVPKAERHTHMGLNGNPRFLFRKTGVWVSPLKKTLTSMDEMHQWVERHITRRCARVQSPRLWVESGLQQAARDGVTDLWAGEDVWALEALWGGDIAKLLATYEEARQQYAPDCRVHLQMGFSRHCGIDDLQRWAEPLFVSGAFACVDLYGDEAAQPIENFVPLYRQAKQAGLRLRAHVGEWGSAADVRQAVELLELDEVQHGIAAAADPAVMRFLAERGTLLNICPTSNVLLGRVPSLAQHPIRALYDAGIKVTLGSDDLLVFGSSASQEYLKLYQCGLMTAAELDQIRRWGLAA